MQGPDEVKLNADDFFGKKCLESEDVGVALVDGSY